MVLVKRILAIIIFIFSAVFIISCLVGVVFSWSINTPITNAIMNALTGVESILTVTENGLERVSNRLAEAQTNVDEIEENVEAAGDTLSEASIVYEIVERTVGDELFPKIETAAETIVNVRDSIIAFNGVLEAINEVPFVEVPTLSEALDTAAEQIEAVQSDVADMRSDLQEIKEEAISKPVTAITDRTTRISVGLEGTQTALSNTQANIDTNLTTVAGIKSGVPGLIDLVSIVLSLVFIWIALGQVALIAIAWGVMKRVDATAGKDMSVADEE